VLSVVPINCVEGFEPAFPVSDQKLVESLSVPGAHCVPLHFSTCPAVVGGVDEIACPWSLTTLVAPCVPVTSPLRLPVKFTVVAAFVAFVAFVAVPLRFAVMVLAWKEPEASRITSALAVFAEVAVVALLATFPAVAMVARLLSASGVLREIFGAVPPLLASGELAETLVTVPVPVLSEPQLQELPLHFKTWPLVQVSDPRRLSPAGTLERPLQGMLAAVAALPACSAKAACGTAVNSCLGFSVA
jgi:hypothetical protein